VKCRKLFKYLEGRGGIGHSRIEIKLSRVDGFTVTQNTPPLWTEYVPPLWTGYFVLFSSLDKTQYLIVVLCVCLDQDYSCALESFSRSDKRKVLAFFPVIYSFYNYIMIYA
jgi:hypothetical protein